MYSTKTAITVSIKDLLDKLNDYDIYSYYIGNFKVGKPINSPLRNDDKNPSFCIFRGKEGDGKLFFKDFGSGESGNALAFVKCYKGVRTRNELERELLRIVRKMNPNGGNATSTYSNPVSSGPTEIGIVRQPFTDVDKQYWKQFHIGLDTLKKFQVFSIKYFLCNNIVRGVYKDTSPMYAYKVYNKFKIYRPLASKYTKWRTNLSNSDIQGLEELPSSGGNLLIITKSLKDVMCLYEMGYDAIAAASETTFIPDTMLPYFRNKWQHVVILYDRDKTGMKQAREYSKQYKMDAIFVHKKFKAKDISDAVKNNNFYDVKDWLKKALSKYEKN